MIYKGLEYSEHNGQLIVEGLENQNYAGKVVIPGKVNGKDVIQIASEAFAGTDITGVYFSNAINIIGDRAFGHCKKLEFVEIHRESGVTFCNYLHVGVNAFAACVELKKFQTNKTLLLDEYAFAHCSKLEKIDKVKEIQRRSLYGCVNLKEIDIVDGGDISRLNLTYTNLEKCIFWGSAKISDASIDSLRSSSCSIECFEDSNLCDLLYNGINITILELPF